MDKLSKKDLSSIIANSLPGYEVAEAQTLTIDSPSSAQMQSVGLKKIQEKLADQVKPYRTDDEVVAFSDNGEDVVQVVEVTPKKGRFAHGGAM